jgi:5'-3' exonuclease
LKLIIDGNNFAFRPMVATRDPLINVNNENVTVLHGMVMMTMSLIRQYDVDEIVFCWDKGKSKPRLELCPDYKGNRKESEAGAVVHWSLPILQEALRSFGVKQICFPGIESDDTMFVLSSALSQLNKDVMVISGDKDVLQVINPFCTVYSFARNKQITLHNFEDITGVPFQGFVDYLCMVGDTADNIKGVEGIGETIAKKLLQKYKTLDGIMQNENEIRMLASVPNPEKLMAKKAISLFEDRGMKRMQVNRQIIELGVLVPLEEKKRILTDYATQQPVIDKHGMAEFFRRYCLIENLRNVDDIARCFDSLVPNQFGFKI